MKIMSFTAEVISGAGRGKTLGIPTLNLKLSDLPTELSEGIYACWVQVTKDERYPAAMHYGPRPVFKDSSACEVHLIDTVLAKRPSNVFVEVIKKIRGISNFPSKNELIKKIAEDIMHAKKILNSPIRQAQDLRQFSILNS